MKARGSLLLCLGLFFIISTLNLFSQDFVPTGSMNEARASHTATVLNNGIVLVTGGETTQGPARRTDSAELYDPTTGTWRFTLNRMTTARSYHAATLLKDGRVLITGGLDANGQQLLSAEIFDPSTNVETFTPVSSMSVPRANHFAFLQCDGSVIVVSGPSGTPVEVFDGTSWTAKAPIPSSPVDIRVGILAVKLTGGRIWIAANSDDLGNNGSVYVYDPSTDVWVNGPALATKTRSSSAALLPSDLIWKFGGIYAPFFIVEGYPILPTEIYDPGKGKSIDAPSLNWNGDCSPPTYPGGSGIAGASLPDSKVLLTGGAYTNGCYNFSPQASRGAAFYDPFSNSIPWSGLMAEARFQHTVSVLQSGEILVAGGLDGSFLWHDSISTAEVSHIKGFLDFPLKSNVRGQDDGLTPSTAPVNSVFDHMMYDKARNKYGPYSCDQVVTDFTGQNAKYDANYVEKCRAGYRLKHGDPTGISLLPRMTYRGAGTRSYLFYDGHAGIDYQAELGTQVYAAINGKVHYPRSFIGSSKPGAYFHVMTIVPYHHEGKAPPFLVYYLHLSTYKGQKQRNVADPNPAPGCDAEVSLPLAEGADVKAGCLVALSGKEGTDAPHLHFEIQRVVPGSWVSGKFGARQATVCRDDEVPAGYSCVPVDPYGWIGTPGKCDCKNGLPVSGDPYYCLTGIQNSWLWKQEDPVYQPKKLESSEVSSPANAHKVQRDFKNTVIHPF